MLLLALTPARRVEANMAKASEFIMIKKPLNEGSGMSLKE